MKFGQQRVAKRRWDAEVEAAARITIKPGPGGMGKFLAPRPNAVAHNWLRRWPVQYFYATRKSSHGDMNVIVMTDGSREGKQEAMQSAVMNPCTRHAAWIPPQVLKDWKEPDTAEGSSAHAEQEIWEGQALALLKARPQQERFQEIKMQKYRRVASLVLRIALDNQLARCVGHGLPGWADTSYKGIRRLNGKKHVHPDGHGDVAPSPAIW